ncbi:MAG: hypothetical protein ACM3JG_16140 [Thiohalocapsa sp.]
MTGVEGVGCSMEGTSRHAYPASAMIGDYLRAAAGLVPAGAVFAVAPVGAVAVAVLGSFAAIFALFGVRTVLRHGTRLEMNERGLRAEGLSSGAIAWAELDRMKLAYYSTRRDRKNGWMQLELGAGRARVRLDSRIAGFDQLVQRAADAAGDRGIALNEATLANLEALGIRVPETGGAR